MEFKTAQKWLTEIKYRDYKFELMDQVKGPILICTRFDEDSVTGEKHARVTEYQIDLSKMDTSAFVHKVFGFMLGLAQHEVCEFFKFMDIAIFNPHADVFTLQSALTETYKKLN